MSQRFTKGLRLVKKPPVIIDFLYIKEYLDLMAVRAEEISQAIGLEGKKGMPFSRLDGVLAEDGIPGFEGSRLIGEVSRLLSKGEVSLDFDEQGITLSKK